MRFSVRCLCRCLFGDKKCCLVTRKKKKKSKKGRLEGEPEVSSPFSTGGQTQPMSEELLQLSEEFQPQTRERDSQLRRGRITVRIPIAGYVPIVFDEAIQLEENGEYLLPYQEEPLESPTLISPAGRILSMTTHRYEEDGMVYGCFTGSHGINYVETIYEVEHYHPRQTVEEYENEDIEKSTTFHISYQMTCPHCKLIKEKSIPVVAVVSSSNSSDSRAQYILSSDKGSSCSCGNCEYVFWNSHTQQQKPHQGTKSEGADNSGMIRMPLSIYRELGTNELLSLENKSLQMANTKFKENLDQLYERCNRTPLITTEGHLITSLGDDLVSLVETTVQKERNNTRRRYRWHTHPTSGDYLADILSQVILHNLYNRQMEDMERQHGIYSNYHNGHDRNQSSTAIQRICATANDYSLLSQVIAERFTGPSIATKFRLTRYDTMSRLQAQATRLVNLYKSHSMAMSQLVHVPIMATIEHQSNSLVERRKKMLLSDNENDDNMPSHAHHHYEEPDISLPSFSTSKSSSSRSPAISILNTAMKDMKEYFIDRTLFRVATHALVKASINMYIQCLIRMSASLEEQAKQPDSSMATLSPKSKLKKRQSWRKKRSSSSSTSKTSEIQKEAFLQRMKGDIRVLYHDLTHLVIHLASSSTVVLKKEFELLNIIHKLLSVAAAASTSGSTTTTTTNDFAPSSNILACKEMILTLYMKIGDMTITKLFVGDLWHIVDPDNESKIYTTLDTWEQELSETFHISNEEEERCGCCHHTWTTTNNIGGELGLKHVLTKIYFGDANDDIIPVIQRKDRP